MKRELHIEDWLSGCFQGQGFMWMLLSAIKPGDNKAFVYGLVLIVLGIGIQLLTKKIYRKKK